MGVVSEIEFPVRFERIYMSIDNNDEKKCETRKRDK